MKTIEAYETSDGRVFRDRSEAEAVEALLCRSAKISSLQSFFTEHNVGRYPTDRAPYVECIVDNFTEVSQLMIKQALKS